MPDFTKDDEIFVSKTRRKRDMHQKQTLGTSLIGLGKKRLMQLNLPETLLDAILTAETITARSAKARHLQYIGKLMRDETLDITAIETKLKQWQITGYK